MKDERKTKAQLIEELVDLRARLAAMQPARTPSVAPSETGEYRSAPKWEVLEAINWVFGEALTCETVEQVANVCLKKAEELTGSKFGFITEVNAAGRFDTFAISDPGWSACRIPGSRELLMANDLEIRGVRGRVVTDGRTLILNNPTEHPDWIEPPEGHPEVTSFMGVPLKQGEKVIGIIGLGNKESGYDAHDQRNVEELSTAFLTAVMFKRAETELRQSESRFKGVFESDMIGCLFWDANGDITDANEVFLKTVGYTRDEVLSGAARWRDMTPPEYKHLDDKALEEVATTGAMTPIEKEYIRKDGSRVPILLGAASLPGSTLSGLAWVVDITDSRRAKEELKKHRDHLEELVEERAAEFRISEKKYRTLFDSSRDGIIFTDMEGKIQEVNQAYLDMVGYTMDEVRKLTYRDMTPAKWHEMEAGIVSGQIMARGYSDEYEKEYIRKDGTVFPVSIKVWLTRDEEGEPAGICGIVRDITDRKRADEELRTKENAIRSSLSAVALADLQGKLTFVNPSFLKFWGYDDENQVVGRRAEEFWQMEDRAAEVTRELRDKGNWLGELTARRSDGSSFDVQVAASMITGAAGEPVGMMASFLDVTEQKVAERKYSTIVQAALDGFWICDMQGRLTAVNDSYCRMIGYTREELLRMRIPDVEAVEEPEETARHIRKVIEEGYDRFESRHRRKDGQIVDVEISAQYFGRGSDALAVFVRDITDRKRAEEEVRQAAARLGLANKELEAFAYSVSHDLRAPLRTMDGFSQALLEDYADKVDPEGRDCLMRVRRGAQRMGELIDDLLALSRVTRKEMSLEEVSLSALARRVGDRLEESQPDHAVEFTIQEGLVARGDRQFLQVMFANLLGNAWKFTTGQLNPRVEFGAEEDKGVRTYFVRDNGVGFDPAYAGKLFGAFQRLHSTSEFEGSGIGLATVQRIIHRHGSKVWAEGAVGKGATFYFTLG